jgi:hypothetical protein
MLLRLKMHLPEESVVPDLCCIVEFWSWAAIVPGRDYDLHI